jgi:glycosyltransferase involved in cell wall biosynthesis
MHILGLARPMLGGAYSFFLNLRYALKPLGVDLTWAASGRQNALETRQIASAEDFSFGELLCTESDDPRLRAAAIIDYAARVRPSLVMYGVFGDPVETQTARHLPTSIARFVVAHTITIATYRAARAIRDSVHATVGVSPRIASDLIRRYGFDPAWTMAIPNAVELNPLLSAKRPARCSTLRLLSLGRVEHASKGVLWLPAILEKALGLGADLTLTVGGDGPDLGRLKRLFAQRGLSGRVRFLGAVPRQGVPQLMAEHDVFLFPSVFEGFGLTVVEAMAAGCVPVASRVSGVTDLIVTDGRTGRLFPVHKLSIAAEHIFQLWRNPAELESLSSGARQGALAFGLAQQGSRYIDLFRRILAEPRHIKPPVPLDQWRVSPYLKAPWWNKLPAPVKGFLRVARERFG